MDWETYSGPVNPSDPSSNSCNLVYFRTKTKEQRLKSLESGTIYFTDQLIHVQMVINAWIRAIQRGIKTPPVFEYTPHPTGAYTPVVCLGSSTKEGTWTAHLIHLIYPDAWEGMAKQMGLDVSVYKSLFASTDIGDGYFIVDIFDFHIGWGESSTTEIESWSKERAYHVLILPVTMEFHEDCKVELYHPPTTFSNSGDEYSLGNTSKVKLHNAIDIAEASLRSSIQLMSGGLVQLMSGDIIKEPIQGIRFKWEKTKGDQENNDGINKKQQNSDSGAQMLESEKRPFNFSAEWWAAAKKVEGNL